MNSARSPEMPRRLSLALSAFWVALTLSVILGMSVELGPVVESLRSRNPEGISSSRLGIALALAALFLLLTPKFIGSLIAAVMLVLVKHRVAWGRWVLLFSLVVTAGVVALDMYYALASTPPRHLVVSLVKLVLFSVLAISTAQLFSSEATAWFQTRTHQKNETSA